MEIVVKTEDGTYAPLPEDKVVLSKDELEAKYLPADRVTENYVPKTAFESRLNRAVANQLEHAHENEAVIARVLESHTPPGADIDAAKDKWEQGRLRPLQDKYERLRGSLRNSEVSAKIAGVFAEDYTRPLPGGKPSAIQVALNDQFLYNEEYGYVAAVDSAGNFVPSNDPTNDKPFRDVDEHLRFLTQDSAWEPYLKQPAKNAGGAGPHGKPAGEKKSFDPASATPEEKRAFIKEHGVDAWMKLIS